MQVSGDDPILEIQICSLSGQVLQAATNLSMKYNIDVSAFASGLYIVRMKKAHSEEIKKLVIQH
jgi:hypothetical protein